MPMGLGLDAIPHHPSHTYMASASQDCVSCHTMSLLWGEARVRGVIVLERERWMAHGIGWMAEHIIGEAITWTPFVSVDVNGKHKNWKSGRHIWWVLWLWSGSLWLINIIQRSIIRCFPKEHHSSHLCWLFQPWNHHWKKRMGYCEGVKRQPRQ